MLWLEDYSRGEPNMVIERDPDYCNRCGEMGFYYPSSTESTSPWKKINKDRIVAFDPRYRVPHWYVCSATPHGTEQARRLGFYKDNATHLPPPLSAGYVKPAPEVKEITTETAIPKTDNVIRINYFDDVKFPPDVVAQLIVKIQVMEMTINEIKKLLTKHSKPE